MGDSDDEYDRRGRGRDKFAKERNDFQDNRSGAGSRREFGGDRRPFVNRDNKQFRTYRPDGSPPMKRSRRDWGDDTFESPAGARRHGDQATSVAGSGGGPPGNLPPMMTIKQFLANQEDTISDEEAIQKYQEYKLEYKRQQLHAFFVNHKDQEWFRLKYHPEDSAKRKQEQQAAVRRRLEVFLDLMDKGLIEKCQMDQNDGRQLIKLMDAVVVKLEGGTDDDIALLEKMDDIDELDRREQQRQEEEMELKRKRSSAPEKRRRVDHSPTKESDEENGRTDKDGILDDSSKKEEKDDKDGDDEGALSDGEMSDKDSHISTKSKSKSPSPVSADEKGALDESSTAVQQNPEEPEEPMADQKNSESSPASRPPSAERTVDEPPEAKEPQMLLHKTASIFLRNIAPTITKQEVETLCQRYPGFLRVSLAEPLPERRFYRRGWVSFRRDVNIKDICWNLNSIRLKDCDLGAIVNRDLTKRIRSVNGITAHKPVGQNDLRSAARLVQLYDKRCGLWDADCEKAKAEEPSYSTISMEYHFSSKNPLLKNITDFLIEEASAEEDELLGLSGANGGSDSEQKITFEKDDEMLKVLDRLLLYLRVVHSVDYYNHGEYPNEDEMPNRCGLIHVRGPTPTATQNGQDEKTGSPLISLQFVNEFIKGFDSKMQHLLALRERLNEADMDKLGKKDEEKEVETFINANCVELAKDKWLCPLSGKKFKGPEFVRKHIANKHVEKLDEVRVEVAYYNNYLADPKRPADVDIARFNNAGNMGGPSPMGHIAGGGFERGGYGDDPRGMDRGHREFGGAPGRYMGGGGYHRGYGNDYGPGGGYGGGGYRRDHYQRRDYNAGGLNRPYANRGGPPPPPPPQHDGRRDPRVPVTYTDLDAPEDVY